MNPFEVFLEIVLQFSDLRWSEFRDDLVVKCMKVLRKFRDGQTLEEVLSDKKLSSEIESVLGFLESFAKTNPPEVTNRLIDALNMFTKAPAPCKVKIIALMETMLGREVQR
ncbi:hypothetical protein BCF55_0760 [Hydrogenivirga caldilitoris]|uniref:Uncharacterized protein n=1 Tax=Hydrogenivirga caldilitoris TaxID=246264 RepID=A0A497XNH6_9AQUI|nr:hypothetical protein [Hydrogenivirga caldilitoris]RLJ70485.1 hypothetical protein BCF55_0760 [Hydrogenivirga caldilitoris]